MKKPASNFIAWGLIAIIIIAAGGLAAVRLLQNQLNQKQLAAQEILAPYLNFSNEIYDIIQQNYWDKIPDRQLTSLYQLAAAEINTTTPARLSSQDKAGLDALIISEIKTLPNNEKKTFVTALANAVLNNLQPLGRSQLYTQAAVQTLSNEINNVDTSTNLYNDLGVNKNADQEQINQAYRQKSQDLKKQNTPESQQQLALVNRAYEALKTPQSRQVYDQTGSEPAVAFRDLGDAVYYIKISRFVPTLLSNLKTTAGNTPKTANALILDLRGNIGGAIDQLPALLSAFAGAQQTAFEFYHQGSFIPYSTPGPALPQISQFKNIAVLIDSQTQSSAEVLAGAFKKARFGTLVGGPTRGWGTIERVFPLDSQIDSQQVYSVFLVHTLTLTDADQPIDGRGIEPDINISDKNWSQGFLAKTGSRPLLTAVRNLLE